MRKVKSITVCVFMAFMLSTLIGCTSQQGSNNNGPATNPETPAWIIRLCEAESKSSCHGDCLDGFSETCYFDSSEHNKEELVTDISLPPETKNACFALHSSSVCGSCYNIFEIRKA